MITLNNEGSFSKAAEILNISQPSLSQYIKKIEQQLGISLFERTNGCVRLTDAGKIYIDIGKKILNLNQEMLQHFLDISDSKEGTVLIGTTPFRSIYFFPGVIKDFNKIYPSIIINISEEETYTLKECAARGDYDICITTLPIDDTLFNYEIICEEELVIAIKKGSALDIKLKQNVQSCNKKYDAVDFAILNDEKFIMLSNNQIMQKELAQLTRKFDIKVHTAAVVNSLASQIQMVIEGLGAALIPDSLTYSNDLNYYSVTCELPKRQVVVIYNKNKKLSTPVKTIIDIMKNRINKNPPA